MGGATKKTFSHFWSAAGMEDQPRPFQSSRHRLRMKGVHFLLKPPASKDGGEREPTGAAHAASGRDELRGAGDGGRPEPSAEEPGGTEKPRKPATPGRHFRAARKAPPLLLTGLVPGPPPECEGESLDAWSKFVEDANKFSLPYLYLVDNILKSKYPAHIEKFRGQSMTEIIKLNNEIKQAQIQQKPLINETRQLYTELAHVQAENRFFQEYLANKTEEYKKQPNNLWTSYLEKVRKMESRKQMSSSKHEAENARLKSELLEKEKMQYNLKRQLKEMKAISMLKEKQEKKLLALKEEKEKIPAETLAKIQEILIPFLQEKVSLEEQLREPNIKQYRKHKLLRKTQGLESVAWLCCLEFSQGICKNNLEVQKELLQLTQKYVELEAVQKQLKTQKRQLQQKQWYLESLVQGRKHLQRQHTQCPKEQQGPGALSPSQGTK